MSTKTTVVKTEVAANPKLVELAKRINLGYRKSMSAFRTSLDHAREIGTALMEAKRVLEEAKEKYLVWVKENCEFSAAQAQRYVRIADRWNEVVAKTKDKEPGDVTMVKVLKLLSRSDDGKTAKSPSATKLTISSTDNLSEQRAQAEAVEFKEDSPARTFAEKQAAQIAQQIVRLVNRKDENAPKDRGGNQLDKNVAALALLHQIQRALQAELLFEVATKADAGPAEAPTNGASHEVQSVTTLVAPTAPLDFLSSQTDCCLLGVG